MEQFVVSARKYRPQAFEAVVGQSHITDTLLKSVENDHLAQALLFCGPRGVGKTTCARILAKVINAGADLSEDELALNIFELDAASNNSVDDIRRLIDQVRFAPQTGKFKVYIIDEVHMLSQQAFNAFLKTLEEPPTHAIFILATTEKHKIIPTILSRCQIFDFKRITVEDIANHLAYVADQEGINAEPEALHMIAEKADGALRDALSLFDRMISFSGNTLTYTQVVEVLDILDYNYYFKGVELAQSVNYPDLLLLYNEVLDKGFNGHEFVVGMSKHFRDLLVAREVKTVELLEVGPAIKERYLQQSADSSTRFLLHGLKVFNELDGQYKNSSQPRILVELGLLKLVEFISQEKKKQQPQVNSATADSTDGFLPDSLPKRDQSAPAPPAQEPPAPTAPAESAAGAPATAVDSLEVPESLPEEPVTAPPVVDPAAAFEADPTPTPTPEPVQATAPRRTTGRRVVQRDARPSTSGLSVMDTLNNLEKQEGAVPEKTEVQDGATPDIPVVADGTAEVYSKKELETAITEYAKRRDVKTAVRSLLMGQMPKILDKNTLEMEVDNNIEMGYFNEEQQKLVPYLRTKLKNANIRFEVKMVEREQTRKLYLPEEKFKYMAEKNPNLVYLRQKIQTDLE
ncbi:MAG TPA: DNA polymerase III, subunit gamma and tau [Cryomorphaceae bacterium]|nr:DNA polymerase III, subunit gamma and tau [Cryomorphaceae bacterium]